MNFLAAKQTLANFGGGTELPFTLAMSGTVDQLVFYLRAHAAAVGRAAKIETLPFGTLQQFLLNSRSAPHPVVALLFPWDLVLEADWRSGIPEACRPFHDVIATAESVVAQLEMRVRHCFYVPAPTPPLWPDLCLNTAMVEVLISLIRRLGADVLLPENFALSSYLASGVSISGRHVSAVAERMIASLLEPPPAPHKVIVSDLDNVMWSGVIGEDGLGGIAHSADGRGWKHFLYQCLLRKMKTEGTLLAAVTRNDLRDAALPFETGGMVLKSDDLVTILASYHAKSAQLREIATRLGLGLDSLVFVDDNPVELAEVSGALPQVTCLAFPSDDDALPNFFVELQSLFARREVTSEDKERTQLYRNRMEVIHPSNEAGSDLREFLGGLNMRLQICDRSGEDRVRALQLINKTNQFNLNGRRWHDGEIDAVLAAGGALWTATLTDRTGSHGEILCCLVDASGLIVSFVMSCRVLQRRVEFAFLAWLRSCQQSIRGVDYAPTERNEPLRLFLKEVIGELPAEPAVLLFDAAIVGERYRDDLQLVPLVGGGEQRLDDKDALSSAKKTSTKKTNDHH